MATPDYYAILGVAVTATGAEIKARFRFLSHAYHPDKFASDEQRALAEEEFKRINAAYQILSDPIERAKYDANCGVHASDDQDVQEEASPRSSGRAATRQSARHPYCPPPLTFVPAAAKWSLALGIFGLGAGLFASVPAIFFGHCATWKIRRFPNHFSGQAIAWIGLIIGYLATVLHTAAMFSGVAGSRFTQPSRPPPTPTVQFAAQPSHSTPFVSVASPNGPLQVSAPSPTVFASSSVPVDGNAAPNAVTIAAPQVRETPLAGERFADTRTRLLPPEELGKWRREDLQYAINEIFARHGAEFPDKSVQRAFSQFAWYHPVPHVAFDDIEKGLGEPELTNLKSLAAARDALKRQKDAAAGAWFGIFYWKTFTGQQFATKSELVFDDNLTQVTMRNTTLDGASDWVTYRLERRGRSLRWMSPTTSGTATYINITTDPTGTSATATSQCIERGKLLGTAAGTFSRTDVPLPIPRPAEPNPLVTGLVGGLLQGFSNALQNAATSSNSQSFQPSSAQSNAIPVKHRKKP